MNQKKLVKNNYSFLIQIGVPSFILDYPKKWSFFLQEGWDGEMDWHYEKEMSNSQQIELYKFLRENRIESCLADEVQAKLKLLP